MAAVNCDFRKQCLHLVVSFGHPGQSGEHWQGTEGSFRRMPIGDRKIGDTAATGKPIQIEDVTGDSKWIAQAIYRSMAIAAVE